MIIANWKKIALIGLLASTASACAQDEQSGIATTTGTNDPWGDSANCKPGGCAPGPNRPGRRNRQEQESNVEYSPTYLGLLHVTLGKNDDIEASHALYDLEACRKAYGLNAHEQILNLFETATRPNWPSLGECASIPEGTGKNFQRIRYFGQTDIYMDVDGLKSNVDDRHPVIPTKYSAGDRVNPVTLNYSFYEAKVQDNSIDTRDHLLYVRNYFSHDDDGNSWRKLTEPTDIGKPGKIRIYSLNVHLLSGSGKIPIIIDPDTGNGSDD